MRGLDPRDPLARSLGIPIDGRVLLRSAPSDVAEQIADAGETFRLVRSLQPGTQFEVVIAFARTLAEAETHLRQLRDHLADVGALWIAWPVGKQERDEACSIETVRALGADAGLIDGKTGPVGAGWRGIRFVVRSY